MPNWQMRYTTRSSMYCLFKGSEFINDVTWPEYTRRLLSALDREREGADIDTIVQSLRGQTCSIDTHEGAVVGHAFTAPTADGEYLPPAESPMSSGFELDLDAVMTPWLRPVPVFSGYSLLPDAGICRACGCQVPYIQRSVEIPWILALCKSISGWKQSSREVDYKQLEISFMMLSVWSNCNSFNSPDSAIIIVSEILSRHFERGLGCGYQA